MNLNTIELRLLRGFAAIARTGNFVSAAQQMHVTQSALSQQMKELVERLGLTLFERHGRRSILTEAGRDLVQRIVPLIEQLDEALLQSSSAAKGVTGRLRVGATQTYVRAIALPAALALVDSHQNLQIDMRQFPAQRLLADLLDGEIDIAIFPNEGAHNNLVQTPLLTERFGAIGTPATLKKLGRSFHLKSLEGHPIALLNRQFLMRETIDRQLRYDKVELDVRLELSSMDDVIAAVSRSRLIAIGTELACLGHPELAFRALEGKFLSRSASLYWRRGRVLTGALLAFQAAVMRISAELSTQQ
jgi:LysR family transcriptional regulator, cyn operon transcriptional activator